jgi:hypothetical protein
MGTNRHSCLSGLKFHPVDKGNAIADCLENQFTPHGLYDENHAQRVEAESKLCFKLKIMTALFKCSD